MLNYASQKKVESAISFLVKSIEESGKNPKPVILHSLRVALYLDREGYDESVVTGAILHDILEDTNITQDQIKEEFGDEVTRLIDANTFDDSIEDKQEQYRRLFSKCLKSGKSALIIKAADILDNSDYYDRNKELLEKMQYFIEVSSEALGDEKVWQELNRKYESLLFRE